MEKRNEHPNIQIPLVSSSLKKKVLFVSFVETRKVTPVTVSIHMDQGSGVAYELVCNTVKYYVL